MTKLEVNGKVAEAIEELRKAQPGRGPAETRSKHKAAANELMASIPRRDMVKVEDDLLSILSCLV